MKKKDFVLIAGIMIVAFFLLFVNGNRPKGQKIQISVDGTVVGVYELDQNREIPIGEHNVLIVKDGKADMTLADCPDQLCVKQNAISKSGETIICLPNKVVVTILGNRKSDVDAIAE